MQAAPAVTVSVERAGMTLTVFASLALLAVAACGVWAWQRRDAAAGWVLAAVVCGAATVLLSGIRQPRRRLRWDGQRWWLGLADGVAPPQPGQVAVAIDLDGWLLLRFRADPPRRWSATHWVALQRSQLRGDWHALRCAVYSPRPALPLQG